MQNNDEELRGLEKKLGRLKPRDMDESHIEELVESLEWERYELKHHQVAGIYPANVLWMRFAPVAAAAGVVLLGTFLLRYENRIGVLQSQWADEAKANAAMATTGKTRATNPAFHPRKINP